LHGPEEEHDCFSDNTHESHYWDAVGLRNVYVGRYQRVDGSMIKGPSLSELVRAADPELDQKLHDGIEQAIRRVDAIRDAAARGKAYDQLLAPDDPEGGELIGEAIQALIAFSEQLREVGPLLGVGAFQFEIEG